MNGERRLRAQGHPGDVDVDLAGDRLGRDLIQATGDEDAGVVVEHVERAVGVRREVVQRLGPFVGLADVEVAGDELGMILLDSGERLVVVVVDADGPSFAGEALRGGQADSGSAAGDEDRGHDLPTFRLIGDCARSCAPRSFCPYSTVSFRWVASERLGLRSG